MDKLLSIISYLVLWGGILLGFLVSKGILESGSEMCFPRAFITFVVSLFISIVCWALITEIIAISDRVREIKESLKNSD